MSKKNSTNKINNNEDYIAIILILTGVIIAITLRLDSIGLIGNIIKDLISGLFSKLSILISFFLISLGLYKIINRENYTFKNFKKTRFILIIFLVILVYGYFNYDNISSYQDISIRLLFDILNQSKKGDNVGIITFLVTFVINKLIGKIGIAILILILFSLIILIFYRNKTVILIKNIYSFILNFISSKKKIELKIKNKNYNDENVHTKSKPKTKKLLRYEYPSSEKENFERTKENIEMKDKCKESGCYMRPSTDLLKSYDSNIHISNSNLNQKSQLLESTLKTFKVNVKVEGISVGPVITRYELSLSPGTKVSKITNLSEDLALALAAKNIRIEAPIPGKSLIGVEVPNEHPDIVGFKDIINVENDGKKIKFCMGKNITGEAVISDISKMPHALIAGSTGSGKSVCINTLICSILYNYSPDEVKLLLIDPKVIELSIYNRVPHLVIPVISDMKKAPKALNWCVNEMEKRYKLFSENNSKDIDSYNNKVEKKLYRLVVIIDELADLMMVSSKEVEDCICRIAQKARACGIHLIVATQRPSVDVITGLIKANIPTRIAFAVSSQTDSRTILDYSGAEKLLGKGDMLYKPIGTNKPLRIQGAFISEDEVEKITDFVHNNNKSYFNEEEVSSTNEEIENISENFVEDEDVDELLDAVIEVVSSMDEVSVSYIQRQFRIGFNRASRIMEQLENRNIVGKSEGSKPRKVIKV